MGAKVYACEWSRQAVKALRINLRENGVEQRCEVLFGDCRKVAPIAMADRVILGLLPSSQSGWKTAVTCLRPSGGWLHLHQNVKDSDMDAWPAQVLEVLRQMALEFGREWEIQQESCTEVKSYAPHISHLVLDISCKSRGKRLGSPVTTIFGIPGLSSIDRIPAPTKEAFWQEILPSRSPHLVEGLELGPALGRWTAEYLMFHPSAKETSVSVHACDSPRGVMTFVPRNFEFSTMSFAQLVERCVSPQEPRRHLYFRSIGQNPRKDASWLHVTFPWLAEDLKLPPFVEAASLHSTVLRVSSPNLHLWLHFDVMDNLLIQLKGSKRVKLWPPSDAPNLYIRGSSSQIPDTESPDLQIYPLFKPPVMDFILHEGETLYIPALWFHQVTSQEFAVSVNVFFRHMEAKLYDKRDLYGNRDPLPVSRAQHSLGAAVAAMEELPPDFRRFYGRRLVEDLSQRLAD